MRETFFDLPRNWMLQVRERLRDLPKTNFELGCRFAEMGKWHDALFRFRVTLYLQPNYPQALYNLGCCYYRLGNRAKARATLVQALKQNPMHQDAIFMLASIDPGALLPAQRPQRMPRDLVTKFFTSIVEGYNQAEAENKYRGGVLVAEQLKPLLPPSGYTVADLGCGTGIASIPYRASAGTLIGVDATPAMVASAQGEMLNDRPLFDRVVEADIAQLGDAIAPATADAVLLVNVAQFVGALDGVVSGAARLLKNGGFLALTIEPYEGSDGFGVVTDSGRFGHHPSYARQLAAPLGLTVVKTETLELYPDTRAHVLLFRKGSV